MADIKITLAAARVNAGLRQEDVSKQMGIAKNTLIRWEKGKSKPSISEMYMLSKIYQIPLDNIFLPASLT